MAKLIKKNEPIRKYPGLTEYMESRLGAPTGSYPELQFHCCFCIDRKGDESSKPKLRLNLAKGKAICFRCDYRSSSLATLFRDMNGGHLRMFEVDLIRGELTGTTATKLKDVVAKTLFSSGAVAEDEELEAQELPGEYEDLTLCQKDPLCRRGWNYAKDRGVTPELVKRFKIGYCVDGWYAQRLVFPVFQGGEQVYFTTRYAGTHDRKSLNPPNQDGYYSRDECLLNYDGVVGVPEVALVEGPFDMMAFPHAVAMMGKRLSEVQLHLLERLVDFGLEEVVVGVDADAQPDAIVQALTGRIPRVTFLPFDYGDPWERRDDIVSMWEQRRPLGVADRVRRRLLAKK